MRYPLGFTVTPLLMVSVVTKMSRVSVYVLLDGTSPRIVDVPLNVHRRNRHRTGQGSKRCRTRPVPR